MELDKEPTLGALRQLDPGVVTCSEAQGKVEIFGSTQEQDRAVLKIILIF